LSDAMDEMARALTIRVSVDNLNDLQTRQIVDALKANKGNCRVHFELLDFTNNYKVSMVASQHKVLCSKAIGQLKGILGINFRIKSGN
ncbi:MAG: hypothetical protein WCR72_17250, partial [Bacteroidota bacterium]